jgi:hypothetical protein
VRQPGKVLLIRTLAAAAALACLVVPQLAAADHSASADGSGQGVLEGERGTWTLHKGPTFAAGPPEITDYTVDANNPSFGFATNGTVIMRTRDGAATWTQVYEVPDVKLGLTRIDRVRARGGLVLATLAAVRGGEVSMLVVRSTSGGDSWSEPLQSPLLAGEPGPVAIGAGNDVWAAAGPVIHHSTDAGETFSPTDPLTGERRIERLVPGTSTPTMVWAKAVDGDAYRTSDAGETWEAVPGFAENVHGPVVEDRGTAKSSVITFFRSFASSNYFAGLAISRDGGDHFEELSGEVAVDTAGPVDSFAGVPNSADLVLTTRDPAHLGKDGVYVFNPKLRRMVSIDEFGIAPLTVVQGELTTGAPRFHFYGGTQIWTWRPPTGGTETVLPPVPSLERLPDTPGSAAGLDPEGGEIHVPEGKSKTLPYTLSLPQRATQLDTFFLLDTSTSTKGYIDGLRLGLPVIALGFAAAGIDARYGLGEYQDRSSPDNVRYRRLAAVGPADLLRKALSTIQTAGGEEPGYTAVDAALTGKGLPRPRYGAPVAAQPPGWRPGAVRTMVLIADESFANDPAGSDRDAAVAAIKKSGVGFLGVVIRDPDAEMPEGARIPTCREVIAKPYLSLSGALGSVRLRCQLADLARAAGTRAPAGGTDCDGDGTIDLAAGKPLVCVITGHAGKTIVAVAEPLRRLLIGVTDSQPVGLESSDPAHVSVTAQGDYSKVDLKSVPELAFGVTFACAAGEGGRSFAATLQGTVAGQGVASATPRLVCDNVARPEPAAAKPEKVQRQQPEPAPVPNPPAPASVSPPAPQPAPQLVAPPVPVPIPAPVPPPAFVNAPAPANAPAPSAALAAAQREEVAPALRLVRDDDDEDIELAFSPALSLAGVLFGALALWPLPGRTPPPLARVSVREPASRRRRRRRGP